MIHVCLSKVTACRCTYSPYHPCQARELETTKDEISELEGSREEAETAKTKAAEAGAEMQAVRVRLGMEKEALTTENNNLVGTRCIGAI